MNEVDSNTRTVLPNAAITMVSKEILIMSKYIIIPTADGIKKKGSSDTKKSETLFTESSFTTLSFSSMNNKIIPMIDDGNGTALSLTKHSAMPKQANTIDNCLIMITNSFASMILND